MSKADDLKRFLQECDVDDPMVVETPTSDVELQTWWPAARRYLARSSGGRPPGRSASSTRRGPSSASSSGRAPIGAARRGETTGGKP